MFNYKLIGLGKGYKSTCLHELVPDGQEVTSHSFLQGDVLVAKVEGHLLCSMADSASLVFIVS